VLAECVDDRNRSRLTAAGATVVLRPNRAYPEMTVTALMHPGSSEILENLVSAVGERIVLVKGEFRGRWKALVLQFLERGEGLPVAARLKGGAIVTAPPAERELEGDALYVLKSARSGATA
jgi:voltage-gated potassium channel